MNVQSATDIAYLEQALELAKKGLYTTDPNPRVGCIIVKDDKVIGQGWHHYAGAPHAEIYALEEAGAMARGATAYVSLEPCAHQGKTGACTDALIKAGIGRVVAAMTDPYPQVKGRGFAKLQDAGVKVESNCLEGPAEDLNPGYLKRLRVGLPWVRLKMAATLDGRTATSTGDSQWLTGAAARADVQHWRARSSAIVTGSGTVISDNPALTVRSDDFAGANPLWVNGLRQPLRVILDRRKRVMADAQVFKGPGEALWLVAADGTADDLVDNKTENVSVLSGEWYPHKVLTMLAERNCNEVLIETGSELAGAFVRAGLVDEFIFYLAPSLLGQDGRPMFRLPGIETLADQILLKPVDVCFVGQDVRVIARYTKLQSD